MLLNKIKTFYITALLIATSGTVLIGQIYYKESLILLFLSCILFIKLSFNKTKLLLIVFFNGLILLNLLLTGSSDITAYLSLIIKLIAIFIIFNNINLKLAMEYYVFIMVVISGISLLFFTFGVLNSDFVRTHIPLQEVWGLNLRVTPLYIYQEWHMNRNNGLYWEPGAFQAFLNIAILLVFKLNLKNKLKMFYLFILFVTLVTTFSTTGYIVCLLIILSQIKTNISYYKKVFLVLIPIFVLLSLELKLGVISDKFDPNNNLYSSFSRRIYDLKVALELIFLRPFIGWGLQNPEMFSNYRYEDSSNSLLLLGSQFGLIALFGYLYYYYRTIKKYTKTKHETIIIFVVLILLISTENLVFQPIFLIPFFATNFINDIKI